MRRGASFQELCTGGYVMNPIPRSQPHHQAGHYSYKLQINLFFQKKKAREESVAREFFLCPLCVFDDSRFPQQKSMKQLSLCPFFLILISNSVKKACTTLFTPGPVNNSCSRLLQFFCLCCLNPANVFLWFLKVHRSKHSKGHFLPMIWRW